MGTIRKESDRRALLDRINRLSGNEGALWGKMTVDQMMSHLVQSGELPFEATVADVSTTMSRTLIKPLVLHLLPMPKEVKTSADIDQQQNGRKPQGFTVDRELVIKLIERIGTLDIQHPCLAHPFFGPMTAKQWAVLSFKHIDHHLRQFGV